MNFDSVWPYATGDGVRVAIIDSGIEMLHPDLSDRIVYPKDVVNLETVERDATGYWSNGTSYLIYNSLSHTYYDDYWDEDTEPVDVHGHGTHVAGIVAASKNGKTVGV